MAINADKPHLWKADVEKSIDFFNDWFLRFAPETYRTQRTQTTREVAQALAQTNFLRGVTPQCLVESPGVLPMLRMVCAPPIARDRLIGLAHVSKTLVTSMEGKLDQPPRIPPRMAKAERDEQLARICETIAELADRDLFGWLETGKEPAKDDIMRASTVVADRLCGATANPIIRNAQERRQLDSLRKWLEVRGYRYVPPNEVEELQTLNPGSFTFRFNVPVGKGKQKVNLSVDCVIQPVAARPRSVPILVEAKSAGDATNTNKRRKEEAQKYNQLKSTFGQNVQFILFLCGYFEPGYLGYEASEGIDWIWEHRINDLAILVEGRRPRPGRVKEEHAGYAGAVEAKEKERFKRQKDVDAQRTQQERNRLGQFSTPFELAADIVAEALLSHDSQHVRFLEPALGTGVFYSALEARLRKKALDRATGVEVDPAYSAVACGLWPDAPFQVLKQDFFDFAQSPENREAFSLLCTNPPYVRHHHIPSRLKPTLQQRVRTEIGVASSGLSGFYVYFVLLSHHLLAAGATASWLIPSEFLSVNYGRVLREYLLRHVTLIRVHQFDPADVQFDDALVSSCVVTYRKERPKAPYEFGFSYGGSLANPKRERRLTTEETQPEQKWLLHETAYGTPSSTTGYSLSDVFDIKRGIATGANGFFIVDRGTARKCEIPSRFLKPILPSPRFIAQTVIENDGTGFPALPKAKYLLDCALPPEVVKKDYPKLWEYLKSGQSSGVADTYLCSSRRFWYLQERREPALFMATYMGRSKSVDDHPFRFFLNLSNAVATNVFLLLYPKPRTAALLENNRPRMLELLGCLNGLTKQDLINGGRTYGGGLHKLEPRELANLRLHDLPSWLETHVHTQLVLV